MLDGACVPCLYRPRVLYILYNKIRRRLSTAFIVSGVVNLVPTLHIIRSCYFSAELRVFFVKKISTKFVSAVDGYTVDIH